MRTIEIGLVLPMGESFVDGSTARPAPSIALIWSPLRTAFRGWPRPCEPSGTLATVLE